MNFKARKRCWAAWAGLANKEVFIYKNMSIYKIPRILRWYSPTYLPRLLDLMKKSICISNHAGQMCLAFYTLE